MTDRKFSPAKRLRVLKLALMCFAAATTSSIAAPVIPGAVQPGRDRPLPEPPAPSSEYNFSIEAPHRSAVPRAVDEVHFKLNDIQIVGAATISAATFRPLYQDLIGKDVTLSNIYDVADGIERAYRAAGYPLVRAYVPPQRVKDGIFTIKVVEGYVSNVSVEGADEKTQARIKAYLRHVAAQRPLKLQTIERGLLLANDLPGMAATGVLRPAPDTPGASDLIVTAAQPRFAGGLSANNRGSHFSGIWTVNGDVAVNSIFTGGDQLYGDVTVSPNSLEQIGGDLRYRAPIGDNGGMGSLVARYTHGEPGSTLHAFGVKTDSFAFGPRYAYSIIRTRAETLGFDAGFTVQDARVTFSAIPPTISHDKWRVFDVDVNYLMSDLLGGSFGVSLDLAKGLDIFGATPDGSTNLSRVGATTNFTKFAGGARYTHPIAGNFSFSLAAQGQFSFDRLISGEQIAFGGTQIGRGYDPGAITGDHGLGGSVELRYTRRIPDSYVQVVQPFVFADGAATWYISTPGLKDDTIASVGGGVRAWFTNNITGDIELDRTLRAVPGSDGGKKATKVLIDVAIRF